MKRMIWILIILMAVVISGCATEQGGDGGSQTGYPSSHQGHHY